MTNRDPYNKHEVQTFEQERKNADELRKLIIRERIAHVMSTREGREAMEIILDQTGVFSSSFSTNALQMAHNEGRRVVGLELISFIDPVAYQIMLKESHERRTNKRS